MFCIRDLRYSAGCTHYKWVAVAIIDQLKPAPNCVETLVQALSSLFVATTKVIVHRLRTDIGIE